MTTCDCIIRNADETLNLDRDWIGVHNTNKPKMFSTAKIDCDGKITDFKNKDEDGYKHAFIGLAGINNYKQFWEKLEQNKHLDDGWEVICTFYDHDSLYAEHCDWLDTGTEENYLIAKRSLAQGKLHHNMEKNIDDITYFNNGIYVKLFKDTNKARMRIKRGREFESKNLIPKFTYTGNYVYAYKEVEGHNLYENFTIAKFEGFLKWYYSNFAYSTKTVRDVPADYDKYCRAFYQDKTYKRVKQFLDNKPEEYYLKHDINGVACKSISEILLLINWNRLCEGVPCMFHGDMNLGNVIYDGNAFYAIDWREDFGSRMYVGDLYYDLAKIYASICMSWDKLKDDSNINISVDKRNVRFSVQQLGLLVDAKHKFIEWCTRERFDITKIKILANITYLNMAPLHTEKLGNLLFFNAVYNLSEMVK